jgi:hypothetical protein
MLCCLVHSNFKLYTDFRGLVNVEGNASQNERSYKTETLAHNPGKTIFLSKLGQQCCDRA